MPELAPEDAKLVTLARASRARTRAREGAAVRDSDGRTYAAGSVELASLKLSAIQGCVAMAFSSGSTGLEAVALLGEATTVSETDRAVLEEFAGPGVAIHLADPRGTLLG